ncbi:MAG: NUDIX hydrolase [Hyphomicrobiaceae bacterium]
MTGILSRLFASQQELIQYAALPYRLRTGGECVVALVTSRGTGRWIIPKGWPEKGFDAHELIAFEAREEAGLTGTVAQTSIGSYVYRKQLHLLASIRVRVHVHPMLVHAELDDWKERAERQRAWFVPEEAARLVREPELASLLRNFGPPGP